MKIYPNSPGFLSTNPNKTYTAKPSCVWSFFTIIKRFLSTIKLGQCHKQTEEGGLCDKSHMILWRDMN